MKSNLFVKIATFGMPARQPAPGTTASYLIACVLVGLYFTGTTQIGIVHALGWTLFALLVIEKAIKFFNKKDPSIIVMDEVAGMYVAMCCIQLNLLSIFLGFLLFRFFDILKPLGIKYFERIPGALGVVLDDVVAGIFANLVLRLILYVFS